MTDPIVLLLWDGSHRSPGTFLRDLFHNPLQGGTGGTNANIYRETFLLLYLL